MLSPLMHPNELEHFQRVLNRLPDDAHLVEFGCGGSTCWIAERLKPNQRLDSIEHNPEWYHRVLEATAYATTQITIHLHPPELELERYKYACAEEEMPAGLTHYLNPEVDWSDVALVFVDGVARGSVLAMTALRVCSGTTVLLHDYEGRQQWYDWPLSVYQRVHLEGSLLELRR
jgi:hypothetical protein